MKRICWGFRIPGNNGIPHNHSAFPGVVTSSHCNLRYHSIIQEFSKCFQLSKSILQSKHIKRGPFVTKKTWEQCRVKTKFNDFFFCFSRIPSGFSMLLNYLYTFTECRAVSQYTSHVVIKSGKKSPWAALFWFFIEYIIMKHSHHTVPWDTGTYYISLVELWNSSYSLTLPLFPACHSLQPLANTTLHSGQLFLVSTSERLHAEIVILDQAHILSIKSSISIFSRHIKEFHSFWWPNNVLFFIYIVSPLSIHLFKNINLILHDVYIVD